MSPDAETRVRDALDQLAAGIEVAPGAYGGVRDRWQRRERRRRRLAAALAVTVVLVADGVGLCALNVRPDDHVIFDDSPGTPDQPPGRLGQP